VLGYMYRGTAQFEGGGAARLVSRRAGVAQSEAETAASYAAASELGGADASSHPRGVRYLEALSERSSPESFTI
jgi:hypothetical protein